MKGAEKPLAELSTSKVDGYRAAALDVAGRGAGRDATTSKGAAAKLAQVATDGSLAQPYRDLALVKQTMLEFDTIAPELVIARLKPLAVKGNAVLRNGGRNARAGAGADGQAKAEAGQTFGAIAKDDDGAGHDPSTRGSDGGCSGGRCSRSGRRREA